MPNRYLAEITRVEVAWRAVLEDWLDSRAGSWSLLHVQSEVLRAKLVRMHREIGEAWDELEVLCEAGLLGERFPLTAVDDDVAMVDAVSVMVAKWAA